MSPSIDFQWKEGDAPLDANAEVLRPQANPPLLEASVPRERRKAGRGPVYLSNLVLLLIGIFLGAVLGFAVLTVRGQWNARRDLAPVVALQHQALAQNDVDLYRTLADPTDVLWRDLLTRAFPASRLLYDLAVEPRVRRVQLQGNQAELEVEFAFAGERYRNLQSVRLVENQWRLSRTRLGAWGSLNTVEGDYVTLRYRERDSFLVDLLPEIDAAARTFCARYNPPPPCHIDLRIEPNPQLLPFIPGEGALPQPTLTRYRIIGRGDTNLITLNGSGAEFDEPAFQASLLAMIPGASHVNEIYPAKYAAADAQTLAAMRLYEREMPLEVTSPRLVGVARNRPHPYWWLALHEAMADVIMRRALGPVTTSDAAAFTLWAAARGDVALWAERTSGVSLPEITPGAELSSPARIGEGLVFADARMRNAARAFAQFLHTRYGEQSVVDLIRLARTRPNGQDVFAILGTTPEQLASDWAQAQPE